MSLAHAELRRLYKRRIARWMLLAVVAVLAAIMVGTFVSNEKVDPDTIAAAEASAREAYEQELRWHEEHVEECREAEASGDAARSLDFTADCDEMAQWEPQPEWFDPQFHLPPTFEFREKFGGMITALASILALLAFVVGASFVGAEWHTGGMMNLLLWSPRRLQLLGAKLGTLLGSLAALSVLLGAAWTGAFWFTASQRGVTETMTSGVWQSFGLAGLRGAGLVLAAGAVGFGLASLGRHTAMALGTAVAAFVVGVVGVGVGVAAAGLPFVDRWLWPVYVWAWMEGEYVAFDYDACLSSPPRGVCESAEYVITWQHGGIMLGVVVLAVLGAAMWQMRRRDVT